jgi:glycosyltransferase involved in cell wall biosynthesis
MPTVTIGVPVFNGERFIDDALRSLRDQTFTDFEVLVADNASTDSTVAICRRHAAEDPRIHLHVSDENRGAAWNFNRLVDPARGRYFKWAAHDDLLDPTYLERCVRALDADDGAVMAYPLAADVDEDGGRIGPIVDEMYGDRPLAADRVRAFLGFDTSCVEVFGLMRTDVLRATRRIGAYTSSDRTLLVELAARGRFVRIDDELMFRRQHGRRSITMDSRARNAWFDPSRANVVGFPRWRLLAELGRAITAAPASAGDRARMSLGLLTFAARSRGRLGRELVAWPIRTAQAASGSIRRRLPGGGGSAAA